MAKINKYDRRHLLDLARIDRLIDNIYREAAREAAQLGVSITDFRPDSVFSFADYPQTQQRVRKLLDTLSSRVEGVIVSGVRSGWTLANNKNDELCRRVFGDNVGRLSQEQYRRYFSTNGEARDAFLARQVSGLSLSDRVWRYTNQFKDEIELGLDIGIRSGRSADALSRDLRQYLRHPDKLFRRVRDEHGQLQLSKSAAAFHPGQGVYRSSYKNARRLAATETNIAYRTSDHLRWQTMDFVVGIEIVTSNNHPDPDICDDLAGRYPKDFKFTGWHPHCRCHAVSILKTPEEMIADNERIMRGEEPLTESENTVSDVPDKFKRWVAKNQERLEPVLGSGKEPYFIRDNREAVQAVFDAQTETREPSLLLENPRPRGNLYGDRVYATDVYDRMDKVQDVAFHSMSPQEIMEAFDGSPLADIDVLALDRDVCATFSKFGVSDMECSMRFIDRTTLRVQWESADPDLNLALWRTFRVENGVKHVHHDLFEIPESMQGKGLSKAIFRDLYREYKACGVKSLDVFANIDVGGYTWARYGFCAPDESTALGALQTHRLSKAQADTAKRIIKDHFAQTNAPFPMKQIADLPFGKQALLGGDWGGVLDLTNEELRKYFESYMGFTN